MHTETWDDDQTDMDGKIYHKEGVLLVSSAAGVYQAQEFAQDYPPSTELNAPGWYYNQRDYQILLEGPGSDDYDEVWLGHGGVLDNAYYFDEEGNRWHLEHGEGAPDLWRVRVLRITNVEEVLDAHA